ncbi:MAG: PD40 domain-containing protein, partial [Planctomycetaceae bacterium]|nr:PD40 domain-containing protein [Planctomycetaceae bacterium]
DLNQDQSLSLSEWPFHTTHAGAKFVLLDANSDGQLTEAEFTAEGSLPANRLSRDFKVFDADSDGRMTLAEFLTIPFWVPESQRTPIADPIVLLSEKALKELTDRWDEWDADGDGALNIQEFDAAKVGQQVRGLGATKFNDWDLDRDQKVSRDDAKQLLDIAFGVRTPEGHLLREPTGRVVDWRLFRGFTLDREGFVTVDAYSRVLGPFDAAAKQRWIETTDRNRDGKFDFAEFAKSDHRTDPVSTFLQLDADLNGRLTPKELEALTADQQPIAACMFPGFDDDRDGGLSLREYQLTPLVNFLAPWQLAQDADDDGLLQPAEFRFHPGVALAALSADYFRRLDVNQDQSLSLTEFPFSTSHLPPNEIRVRFADGRVLAITIPDYPNIFSPEISPDGKWVAVDGWKRGESNVAAHLLIASLESDEVRDLGIGCIPHWSADSRRIAYSKYGQGVFVRDFELDSEEESIDPQGWAIEFSPDGRKTAYLVNGYNFVIRDVATNEKRSIFAEGKSPYRSIEHNFAWSPDSQRICFKGHRAVGGIEVGFVNTTGGVP